MSMRFSKRVYHTERGSIAVSDIATGFHVTEHAREGTIINRQKLTSDQIVNIGKLWLRGDALWKIGSQLGLAKNTAWKWVNRLQLKKRAPHRKSNSTYGRKLKCLCLKCETCKKRFWERRRVGSRGPFRDSLIAEAAR